MPTQPLTFLQNPKTTDYLQNMGSFQLVYIFRRFIFIHDPQRTQFEPVKLQVLRLSKVPALSSVQVGQDSWTHQQWCATPSSLIFWTYSHNELPLADSLPGEMMINPFLSECLEFFRCVEIFRCVWYNSRSVAYKQPPIRASIAYLIQVLIFSNWWHEQSF